MRWRFWSRQRPPARDESEVHRGLPDSPDPRTTAPPHPDEASEEQQVTPAFSGASPRPGAGATAPPAGAGDDAGVGPAAESGAMDLAGVRADVLALVGAALARDRAGAAEVLGRLDARGPDEQAMASIAALAGLGDRIAAAADVPPADLTADGAALAAVVAQGDTLAARAEPLLRSLAPQASRDLVRLVVRFAAGVPEQDPAVAHLAEAPAADLLLVASVLLAQTVLDGQGDAAALADELADLLPG